MGGQFTGALFLAAALLLGQDLVVRVDVNLRQVDLTVTDAKGHHISDLEPTDFQVLEDGKAQQITNFSWIEVSPPPSGRRLELLKEKPSLLERFSGVARIHAGPEPPAANLKKEEIRRMIAIVAGDTSVPATDRIRKFIDEQVSEGDMVSVRSIQRTVIRTGMNDLAQLRDAMGIFEQFTNDKRQLDAAAERLPRVCWLHQCLADASSAMLAAIRSLQDLPGRKALLYVGRYKGPVEEIVNQANRAGVIIYVLDPAGVEIEGQTVSDMVAPDSERVLAERTGGRRLLSTVGFDLTASFNEVIEDLSGYYLIGYHAADADAKGPAKHKVEVRVLRPGLTVRSRDGVLGSIAPAASPGAAPATLDREQILTKALFSVFTQDGVRIHLEPVFAAAKPNQKKKRMPLARAVIDMEGRDIAFSDIAGGKKQAVVDIAVAVFNEDGSQAGAANKSFTLQVTNEKAASIARNGLQYTLDVALAGPGPYQVRAAVRDQGSGGVGSAYAFLEIPDYNRSQIALSSLILSAPQGAPSAAARPDWNEFAPGATVQYVCEVFGLKTPGKPPGPPSVETEVKLYHGGGAVADIPLSPAKIESVDGQTFLAGTLRIPEGLAPGNYTMQVLAYDRLESSKKKQEAQQWVDVAVVSPHAN